MVQENKRRKPDYGQDVPGMVRELFLAGGLLAAAGVAVNRWAKRQGTSTSRLISWLGIASLAIGVLSALEGFSYVFSSRIGKMRIRDKVLDGLHLRGDETVLDLGCGHGILLIGAAKRLPCGKAIGIDLWSQVDQGKNSRAVTLANAEIEGVSERVEVLNGDMRKLPFANNSIDVVVASLAVHNIESREGRREALDEMMRVLKPGGKVALMDIFSIDEYLAAFNANGLRNVSVTGRNFWYYPPMRIVTASK